MRVVNNQRPIELKRKTGNKEPKSKYYIVAEGDKTEIQYFSGIINNSIDLDVKPIVEIILVENEDFEKGHSHPLRKFDNFNKSCFLFSKKIDKICFVCDRDPGNFFENQYDEMLRKCKEKNYEVYISNPTFEFFLILHSSEVFKLDKRKMKDNEFVSNSKRYLEKELSRIFGCNKTHIDFEKFKPCIRNAIENEKQFCEDLIGLKNNLGSNVGKLIASLLK